MSPFTLIRGTKQDLPNAQIMCSMFSYIDALGQVRWENGVNYSFSVCRRNSFLWTVILLVLMSADCSVNVDMTVLGKGV